MRFLIYNKRVKRTVLILLVSGLLLLSEALTLLGTQADGLPDAGLTGSVTRTRPSGTTAASKDIHVAGTGFYYRMDEKARFVALKNQWQSDHRGDLPADQATLFADQAYDLSSVEEALKQWRYHGGPNPWVFTAKAHLFNDGDQAYLNVPVHIAYRAKVGDLRVNPAIQMTDFNYLKQSARWQNLSSLRTIKIAAIAPGEDILLELGRVNLLDFLAKHPSRWPAEIEVRISSPRFTTVSQIIRLTPDHFVTPTVY